MTTPPEYRIEILNVPEDGDLGFAEDSTPYLRFDVGEGWKLFYPERDGDGRVEKDAVPKLYVIGGPIDNVDWAADKAREYLDLIGYPPNVDPE